MSITKEELIEILARIEAKIDASEAKMDASEARLEAKMDASEARIKEEIKKEIKEELKEDMNILIEYTLAQATFSDLRAKKKLETTL